jgi:hypothetical protein
VELHATRLTHSLHHTDLRVICAAAAISFVFLLGLRETYRMPLGYTGSRGCLSC